MFRIATNQFRYNSHRQASIPIQFNKSPTLGTDLSFKISTSRHLTEEELELHIQRPHAQCLFLGEVLRVPTTSEESADGAAAFHLREARADAPAGGAEDFLLVDLVAGAAATGAEATAATFLLGEVVAGAADSGFCFFSTAARGSSSSPPSSSSDSSDALESSSLSTTCRFRICSWAATSSSEAPSPASSSELSTASEVGFSPAAQALAFGPEDGDA
jgi:hypothetical protein